MRSGNEILQEETQKTEILKEKSIKPTHAQHLMLYKSAYYRKSIPLFRGIDFLYTPEQQELKRHTLYPLLEKMPIV